MREPVFRQGHKQLRPFSESAEVNCRGCSQPLQRVVVDFGADEAFGQVPKKLREHYGIELPVSTIRTLTQHHARRMYEAQEVATTLPQKPGCELLIGEMDGSMIPITEADKEAEDKRKNKRLSWKEARLCLTHEPGSLTLSFGAVFSGTTRDAGQQLFHCALQAGLGRETTLHCVGDGAPWIAEQVDKWFGAQAHYLLDFYHTCDYLAAAAKGCAADQTTGWLDTQKERLKNNGHEEVLEALEPFLEADRVKDPDAPVRACHRYLKNRTQQLDYQGALKQGLPIGSGEIESAHRYVIQTRLKLPGAWWAPENVDPMLSLRVRRANGQWDAYWNHLQQAM